MRERRRDTHEIVEHPSDELSAQLPFRWRTFARTVLAVGAPETQAGQRAVVTPTIGQHADVQMMNCKCLGSERTAEFVTLQFR